MKKQINILMEIEQYEALKRVALNRSRSTTGKMVTVSELVREVVEEFLKKHKGEK